MSALPVPQHIFEDSVFTEARAAAEARVISTADTVHLLGGVALSTGARLTGEMGRTVSTLAAEGMGAAFEVLAKTVGTLFPVRVETTYSLHDQAD